MSEASEDTAKQSSQQKDDDDGANGSGRAVVAVKSNAVVKFSTVQAAEYSKLKCNTDLNLPPINWLTARDGGLGMHQALYTSSGFSSFRLAHKFPDCFGDVDVVTDSENIKRLLKLPYTAKGTISMIVHKVGNTLLLDEFDIQQYILGGADKNWQWLRTLIKKKIFALGRHKEQTFCLRDKSRESLRRKNLLSKFLYYSLSSKLDDVESRASPTSGSSSSSSASSSSSVDGPKMRCRQPVLPEPKLEENVPDPKSSHNFNRNVVWTFEDIRMLIGTDMPIFGGPNRPCISLRLRDMSEPINVLTGIDYWLDNLMCNVPEVLMCYHLDGIVQKYEIIKTEDLPYMENSQFSPQVVRDVAQNILSFLKANATKEGHTYWLFKGRNDDVVKLYDLSTLCQNQAEPDGKHFGDTQDNPFTVPVAMLLYTVARNMKTAKAHLSPKAAGTVRALLESCIKLLPKEQHPQIVTSSHYLLSDLFVPAFVDPKRPQFEGDDDDDSDATSIYDDDHDDHDDDDDDDEPPQGQQPDDEADVELNSSNFCEMNNNVKAASTPASPTRTATPLPAAVQRLEDSLKVFDLKGAAFGARSKRKPHAPEPLVADIVERCKQALRHINVGLSCLEYYNATEEASIKDTEPRAKRDEERDRVLYEEQNPTMAEASKAIPLPYERLSDGKPTLFDTPLAYSTYTQTDTEIIMPQHPNKHHQLQQLQQKLQLQQLFLRQRESNNNHNHNNNNTSTNNKNNSHKDGGNKKKHNNKHKPKDSKMCTTNNNNTTTTTSNNNNNKQNGGIPQADGTLSAEQIQQQVAVNFNSQQFGSWNTHLKLLLLEKACLTYATLAEHCYRIGHYGTSLKCVYMAYRCQQAIVKQMRSTVARRSCLLCLAGDCFFEMYRYWGQVKEFIDQYHTYTAQDRYILKVLAQELVREDCSYLVDAMPNMEVIMINSCLCYENAMKVLEVKPPVESEDENLGLGHLLRRIGNIRNELGLKYMNWASFSFDDHRTQYILKRNEIDYNAFMKKVIAKEKGTKTLIDVQHSVSMALAMKAYDNLVRGINAFTRVKDPVNLAFLYSNMGRFMRFRGHMQSPTESPLQSQESLRIFYSEALNYYDKAKSVLGGRTASPYLWDLINWEIATATFMLGKHLQEEGVPENGTPAAQVALERDIIETLHKALKLCENDDGAGRGELYMYRIGMVHKRIGLFHYNFVKRVWVNTAPMPKNALQLCKHHQEKAAIIFHNMMEFSDELDVHVERVEVLVYQTEKATNAVHKVRNMQSALEVCVHLSELFEHALAFFTDNSAQGKYKTQNHTQNGDFPDRIRKFVGLLQSILKTLIRLFMNNTRDTKNSLDGYKDMYKETLHISKALLEDQNMSTAEMVDVMLETLDRLSWIDDLMMGADPYVNLADAAAADAASRAAAAEAAQQPTPTASPAPPTNALQWPAGSGANHDANDSATLTPTALTKKQRKKLKKAKRNKAAATTAAEPATSAEAHDKQQEQPDEQNVKEENEGREERDDKDEKEDMEDKAVKEDNEEKDDKEVKENKKEKEEKEKDDKEENEMKENKEDKEDKEEKDDIEDKEENEDREEKEVKEDKDDKEENEFGEDKEDKENVEEKQQETQDCGPESANDDGGTEMVSSEKK